MLLGSLLNHLAVKLSDIFNTRFKRVEKNYFRRKVKSDFYYISFLSKRATICLSG